MSVTEGAWVEPGREICRPIFSRNVAFPLFLYFFIWKFIMSHQIVPFHCKKLSIFQTKFIPLYGVKSNRNIPQGNATINVIDIDISKRYQYWSIICLSYQWILNIWFGWYVDEVTDEHPWFSQMRILRYLSCTW